MSTKNDPVNGMAQVIWTPGITLKSLERQAIECAIKFYRGNKTTTAQALGISIRTLDTKLEEIVNDDSEVASRDDETRKKRQDFLHACRNGRPTTASEHPPQSATEGGGGNGSQSPSNPTAQSAVSVPKRENVSPVLPRQSAGNGHPRRG